MDRHALADELRTARFRTTGLRQGYEMAAVDEAVDAIAAQLLADRPAAEIVAAVHASVFPTTAGRRGYDMADVDDLLDRVTAGLGDAPSAATPDPEAGPAADPAPVSPSTTPLPSAVIEPPKGFLARLLGR